MNKQFKNRLQSIASTVLGVLMIIFGLNKFLGFLPVEPPADQTAQQFLGTMFTSYLFVLVAIVEISGGLMIIWTKSRLIGWLLLLPVMFNIVAFHVVHDFVGNGIWLIPLGLFLMVGLSKKASLQYLVSQS